jgi:signal transduction histidine kinase
VAERTSELIAKNQKIEVQKNEVEAKNQKIEAQKNEVEAKNKEILATQKQLIQSSKMASIGTMTAGVAHEINNPTNFAHAAAYMMKDEIIKIKAFLKQLAGGETASPEVLQSFDEQFTKLIELTNTTSEGTTRIKTIVEDLRTFARIDDAKQAQVQVSDLINSTVHLVRTQYDSITIETQLDYEPLFKCFPSKLNQVFMNIIVNACQAIENKRSSFSSLEGKVVIKTNHYENQLIMSFEDNGCGMIEENINRIYEPFYTTKSVGGGTGLGMAISFGIIEEHGGTIEVESEIDKGTKVIIKLDA